MHRRVASLLTFLSVRLSLHRIPIPSVLCPSRSIVLSYLGINCYEMADAMNIVHGRHPNHTLPRIFDDDDEPSSYIQPLDQSRRVLETTVPSKELLLINYRPNTDTTGLRSRIWKRMCHRKHRQNCTFVTCISKDHGVQMANLPRIYERNRAYPFWLSPRGNGIDCHRTWEALYLDIIPVVWNSSLNVLYEHLPVLIINDYDELNETFLYRKLRDISMRKLSSKNEYRYEKLRHAYWRRLILSKSRHHFRNTRSRTNQCWRAKSTIDWKRLLPFLAK